MLFSFVFSLMTFGTSIAAQPGEASGVRRCIKCHSEDGLETGDGEPFIAAQPYAYLVAALDDYQAGLRVDKSMSKHTKTMTREDKETAARYFAGLPKNYPRQPFDAQLAAKGATLHARLCEKCHVDGGRGFNMQDTPGPILAGQSARYLQAQLGQFMALDRDMPSNMGVALLELLPGDAIALVHYYVSRGQ